MSGVLGSAWTTWICCLAVAAIALVRGRWSGTLVLALLALAVLGAIFPPAGALVGLVIVLYLVAAHGVELFGHLTQLFGGTTQQ